MDANVDRRAMLAMAATAAVGGLAWGQPVAEAKGKTKEEKPAPVHFDARESPRMVVYSRPSGQVISPRGMLAAVWSDGRVVRCKDETAPGKEMLAGTIALKLVSFGEDMMEAIGVHRAEYQGERNIVLDSNFHAVCVLKDGKASRVCCTVISREGLDDFYVRYWAARDLILRLAMSAASPVSNAEALNDGAVAMAYGRAWETDGRAR